MRDFSKYSTTVQSFRTSRSRLFYSIFRASAVSLFFKNDTAKIFILEGLLSLFYSLFCVSKLHNEPHNAKRQLAKMPL